MKILARFAAFFLVAVFLLAAGCGKPEAKAPPLPPTPNNAVAARDQMTAARGQIKSPGAPYLQDVMRRADGLEKSGGEAMQAKNYDKAISAFTEARKCYQQAVNIEAGMMTEREAAVAAQNANEAARAAAITATKAEARPPAFVAAENTAKEAEAALGQEEFAKARKLYTRAAEGYKAAQAEADKLLRVEQSNAAQAAKKDTEAARAAASAASKEDARPESFTAAANVEKEAADALAKEDFTKAKELFARATESYKMAQADGDKANRAELSRAAYTKKREAEEERLTARAAFKTDARSESYNAAADLMKEGEAALAQEAFSKAKDLFTRAFEGFKTAQADAKSFVDVETARADWAKQLKLAEPEAALLERHVAAEFAKVKTQAESAATLAATNAAQASKQFVAATTALKDLVAQAKTKENLPKAGPAVAKMESALGAGDWLQTHWALGALEKLIPADPRMADFRAKAAALPWPKELTLDLGGGMAMSFVSIQPGSFTMSDGAEKHQVTLTKPFFMGKFEVTQPQWRAIMGNNPSWNKNDKNPVENLSWDLSQSFIAKINERLSGLKVTMPTEAQWEYACRAGSTSMYCFGDDVKSLEEYAWYPVHYGRKYAYMAYPAGTKKPNAWGLYDMHGNVTEFCSDWFGLLPSTPQEDPQGPASGYSRVFRGGNCRDGSHDLASWSRKAIMPADILNNGGLRLVLVTEAIADYHASLKPSEPSSAVASSTPSTPPPATPPAASSTTPAAPAMTTTAPPQPDDWMRGLPPNSVASYTQARDGAKAGKGLLGLRSWRAMWVNRLRDPTRGFVELEFAELLLSDPSKAENARVEEERKKNNIKEAAFIVQCVRARNVTDSALLTRLEEMAKKLP
jgi:formylglycine-generating enzyme required for sulfatase activity